MPNDQQPEVVALTPEQAARRIGASRSEFYILLKHRVAPPSILVGRRRLFPENGIRRWLEQRAA